MKRVPGTTPKERRFNDAGSGVADGSGLLPDERRRQQKAARARRPQPIEPEIPATEETADDE